MQASDNVVFDPSWPQPKYGFPLTPREKKFFEKRIMNCINVVNSSAQNESFKQNTILGFNKILKAIRETEEPKKTSFKNILRYIFQHHNLSGEHVLQRAWQQYEAESFRHKRAQEQGISDLATWSVNSHPSGNEAGSSYQGPSNNGSRSTFGEVMPEEDSQSMMDPSRNRIVDKNLYHAGTGGRPGAYFGSIYGQKSTHSQSSASLPQAVGTSGSIGTTDIEEYESEKRREAEWLAGLKRQVLPARDSVILTSAMKQPTTSELGGFNAWLVVRITKITVVAVRARVKANRVVGLSGSLVSLDVEPQSWCHRESSLSSQNNIQYAYDRRSGKLIANAGNGWFLYDESESSSHY
ncbi:hypothetical protein C8R43DRAFT_1210342 [Mycena crocata]|nr:hypothetical protein C8R43DRAFT_1210342 [Mycena crocata]